MTMAISETEIRKLSATELCTLAQYLNESDYWKKLMAIVPEDDKENVSLFSPDHFRMIEQAIPQQKRNGAEIFLSEWSTMGRKRPTCKLLLDLLVKLEFFKAADYLAVEVLKINAPERPKQGPAAVVDISDKMLEQMLKEQAGLETRTETDLTWSINYVEKLAELTPVHADNVQPEPERADMIEFSVDRSDMIKFSKTITESDLKKQVSNVNVDEAELSVENYGLQLVESENIPLCVNVDEMDSNDNNSATNLSTTTQSTISSSSTNDSDSMPTTSASESDIPIVVLRYSD